MPAIPSSTRGLLRRVPGLRLGCGVLALLLAVPSGAAAQARTSGVDTGNPAAYQLFAGSELEGYLRTLQNVGEAGMYPWSIRGFSAREVERFAPGGPAGPWGQRFAVEDPVSGPVFGWTQPRIASIYNSAFPWGGNDGPVWAGRGATAEVQFGGYARWGPLSVVVHPVWFQAQNQAFDMAETPGSTTSPYGSPLTPASMDLPQRFGPSSYGRFDPGYSTVRMDAFGLTAGVSTAAQQWGPSHLHPLVMGPAAGGFAHVFLGTDGPRNIGIGRAHVRYVAGRTEHSDYFGTTGVARQSFVTGLVAVWEPRGLPGLELGGTRFFKLYWDSPESRTDQMLRPFETFLKRNIENADARRDQQFASVFARWNLPEAGIEFFGEYVRVDHSFGVRVLVLEPDDQAGYMLGFRRVWEGDRGTLTALRGEVVTSGSTHRERGGARVGQAYNARPIYHEGSAPPLGGHTHHGQLMATLSGHFGNGQTLGLDRYTERGRWSVELDRRVVRDRTIGVIPEDPADVDVLLGMGADMVRFHGRWEVRAGLTGVWELNRHLEDDAFNVNLRAGLGLRVP